MISFTWRLFMLKNFIRNQKENVYHNQIQRGPLFINTIHQHAYTVYRVD